MLFFLFVVRQCLKMSVVLNVWCVHVVSGIILFGHSQKNVVPFKVVSEPDDGTTHTEHFVNCVIWISTSLSYSVALLMVILNLSYHLIPCWVLGKQEATQHEVWWAGRVGNDSHFVFSQTKNGVSSCAPWSSACQVFFVTHFPADTEMCHCSNIGLQFVLLEQIYNLWLCEC